MTDAPDVSLGGLGPSVRLAHVGPPQALASGLGPVVRLAHKEAQGSGTLSGKCGNYVVPRIPQRIAPALLVSFFYLKPFLANKHRYVYRDWVMDSGAFSAHNSGAAIDLKEYIEKCLELMATDPTLTEGFALDVIGDWRASLKNCEAMWEAGVPAIPCWHKGEPWDALVGIAKDYPKIAIGGMVGMRVNAKNELAGQCFARVWPKKIHGFGFGSERSALTLPFQSVDATNWEIGPCKFGSWKSIGQASVRGSKQNLRGEVEWYLDLEKRARVKWAKQMQELETSGPSVRLAAQMASDRQIERSGIAVPTIRLAAEPASGGVERLGQALQPSGLQPSSPP